MSADAVGFSARREFRISVTAVVSAALLIGLVQAIVVALEEPLRPAVVWFINLLIERGRFQVLRVSTHGPLWPVANRQPCNRDGGTLLELLVGRPQLPEAQQSVRLAPLHQPKNFSIRA